MNKKDILIGVIGAILLAYSLAYLTSTLRVAGFSSTGMTRATGIVK